jgi:tetratricopeptide (TPR) repeat protein
MAPEPARSMMPRYALRTLLVCGILLNVFIVYRALRNHQRNDPAQQTTQLDADEDVIAVTLEELAASVPPDAGKGQTDAFGYPLVFPNKLDLLLKLRSRSFAALDSTLTQFASQFIEDFRTESVLSEAFRTFNVSDASYAPLFDEWVTRDPGSANARLARAAHLKAMGWKSRGTRYRSETSDEQIRRMAKYFDAATRDCQEALRIRPNDTVAYAMLQEMARARGAIGESRRLEAIQSRLYPHSFVARSVHMLNLVPRWGGSYRAMQLFAAEARSYSRENPKLVVLNGYVDWDRGSMAELNGDPESALRYYNRALSFGEHWLFLRDRGELYCRMEQYDKALEDLDRANDLRPLTPDILYWRGLTLHTLACTRPIEERRALLRKAIMDLNIAVALNPGDETYLADRENLVARLRAGYGCP